MKIKGCIYIYIYRLVLASGTAPAVTHTRGGVGWVGWGGMLTFMWTCVMKLMLRHAWSCELASWSWCYVTHGVGGGVGWGGMLTFMWTCVMKLMLRHAWGGGWGGVGWGGWGGMIIYYDDDDDDGGDDDDYYILWWWWWWWWWKWPKWNL